MLKANDFIGTYQLIGRLGAGAFGEVWRARKPSQRRSVALKILLNKEVDLDALLQEVSTWALGTGHPNVLRFIGARVFDGQPVLISKYVRDGSLQDWLEWCGGKAPRQREAVLWTQGILAGLAYLHGHKIIHRDLKPANILMDGGTPRIADFGLSRVLIVDNSSAGFGGTIAYSAPEAFRGARTEQTDVWSVGVILYQLLAGRLPFSGKDRQAVVKAICYAKPAPLPTSVPAWVSAVVRKALAKDVQLRFKTATEMLAALSAPAPAPTRATSGADESYGMGVLVGLVLLGGVIWWASQPSPVTGPTSPQPTPKAKASAPAPLPRDFTETIAGVNFEMKVLPGGSFLMGSPASEEGRSDHEGPQHRVRVPAFAISKYEITQAQWQAVMGDNPASFIGPSFPVENISWYEAKAFCQRLSQLTGKVYRLPTEAEWEYAARARTVSPFSFGLTLSSAQANFNGNYPYGDATEGDYHRQTLDVGNFMPNAFGLFDMHGNVREWCEDVWHVNYKKAPGDGSNWTSGGDSSLRVIRGGSWDSFGSACRAASRNGLAPGDRSNDLGFRIVVGTRTP